MLLSLNSSTQAITSFPSKSFSQSRSQSCSSSQLEQLNDASFLSMYLNPMEEEVPTSSFWNASQKVTNKLRSFLPACLQRLHPPNMKEAPAIVTIQLHNVSPSGPGLDVVSSFSLAVEPASSFNLGSRVELKSQESSVVTTFKGWVSRVEELQSESVILWVSGSGKGKGSVRLHIPYCFVNLPWYKKWAKAFRTKFSYLPQSPPMKTIRKRTEMELITFRGEDAGKRRALVAEEV